MTEDTVYIVLKTQIEIRRRVDDREIVDKTNVYFNQTVISSQEFYAYQDANTYLRLVIEYLQKTVIESNVSKEALEKVLRIIENDQTALA
jgi:hypothetical protein